MPYRNLDIIKLKAINELKGVFYVNEPEKLDLEAEDTYLKIRAKEGRIYPDETVKNLPAVERSNKYYDEWAIRRISAEKLCTHIFTDKSPKAILELGSGNGWLASKLADDVNSAVIGLDINRTELEQGARVFNDKKNLLFAYGNIFGESLSELSLDYAVLAASAAYFENIEDIIDRLLSILNEQGEIHFIDNPFYKDEDIESAKKRSADYYSGLGGPEMSKYYFHHKFSDICKKYKFEILYDPNNTVNRAKRYLINSLSPFYWIKIMK